MLDKNNRWEISDLTVRSALFELYWHFTYSPVTCMTCFRNVYLLNCCIHSLSMMNKCFEFHLFVHLLNMLDVKLTLTCLSLFFFYCLTNSTTMPTWHSEPFACFFLALVIHPNASAKPNYVTFVLVVRHAHFFFLSFFFFSCSRASLSLPSGCEKCSARAVQLAPRVRTQAAAMLEHIG